MADAPAKILELVERFERNKDQYRSPAYNEAQTRTEFIDPFFIALGWDVYNEQGYAEAYKDVLREDAIKVGGTTKAPDYAFRIGGTRKFFVEAKKPNVPVKFDPAPAYQLRRYSWSEKHSLAILTNFGEFAVYDCRIPPNEKDKASTARVKYYKHTEYPQKWVEIDSLFSKDAVLKGSFDRYAESERAKRGTAEVDQVFLKEIEQWREALAKNIHLRNPQLGIRELNFAVQRTIDRIVFLRMCEDRAIENYAQLQALLNGHNTYGRLLELYYHADDKYNSGLFHFRSEKGRPEAPDDLTPSLKIDDKVLKQIIDGLYYPKSPYEFSVIGADILGNVYEQFLGKVIVIKTATRADVEEKPEVKKAGGVYYTPTYIVDYIVQNTVGKLCEGKTPRQVSKLRILDPACGSGSFLIGAYSYLLRWYRDRYVEDGPEKHRKEIYQGAGGQWHLTVSEKKRILLGSIYGVDIDNQAVEVTKLNLLLKVLEGENQQTIAATLRLLHERALPDLGSNIKCGNSLIGTDFDTSGLSDEEVRRINPFDWNSEFPEIMHRGGFDAVIGNPPYIRIQTLKEWSPLEVEYYKKTYQAASKGNYDIYVVFVERGLSMLNQSGRFGYILPHKFFNAKYGERLRKLIADGKHLSHVVHFGDQQVFAGATTYTCLLFLVAAGLQEFSFVKVTDLQEWRNTGGGAVEGMIPSSAITADQWNFAVGPASALSQRLASMPVKLGGISDRIAQGIRTSANEVYVLHLESASENHVVARSESLGSSVELEDGLLSMFLQGREIKPYTILPPVKVVIIPYVVVDGQPKLISEDELRAKYPKTYSYLLENRTGLESRERGRMKGSNWYAYIYPKNMEVMRTRKILVPDIADRPSFAMDATGEYAFTSGYAVILKGTVKEAWEYILGLLNSSMLDFYLKSVSTTMRGGFFRYFTQFLEQLPIRTINFDDLEDKARHDKVVELVTRMLDLHKKLAAARIPSDKEAIQRQIDATGREIDNLVYELYGLTEDEIRIVEEIG